MSGVRGQQGSGEGRTLLVGIEGREVGRLEGQFGDVGLGAGGIPLLGEGEGLGREREIVLHLLGELHALAIEPFLISQLSYLHRARAKRECSHPT